MSQTSNDPLGNRDHALSPGALRVAGTAITLLALALVIGVGWIVLPPAVRWTRVPDHPALTTAEPGGTVAAHGSPARSAPE